MLRLEEQPRTLLMALALTILLVVAFADYLTGVELSFSIFYLVAISLAAWFVGRGAGFLISIVSVACWLAGDLAAGAHYSSRFVPWWNASITLTFYLAMVAALSSLRTLHRNLEARVCERTSALQNEMAERERLEKAVLSVSEREQRRIGHDLHDSLCQHLLGAALAAQVLREKLGAKMLPESEAASKLVGLIEDGIEMARSIARGLSPMELDAEGIMDALRELARTTSERCNINCRFESHGQVSIDRVDAAEHLFRIAQEAVTNAIKHGVANNITISLMPREGGIELAVRDDGVGIPVPLPPLHGIGLGIMRHRAAMIPASFHVARIERGTNVTCRIPGYTKKPTAS